MKKKVCYLYCWFEYYAKRNYNAESKYKFGKKYTRILNDFFFCFWLENSNVLVIHPAFLAMPGWMVLFCLKRLCKNKYHVASRTQNICIPFTDLPPTGNWAMPMCPCCEGSMTRNRQCFALVSQFYEKGVNSKNKQYERPNELNGN